MKKSNISKKIITIFIVLAMLVTMIPVLSKATEEDVLERLTKLQEDIAHVIAKYPEGAQATAIADGEKMDQDENGVIDLGDLRLINEAIEKLKEEDLEEKDDPAAEVDDPVDEQDDKITVNGKDIKLNTKIKVTGTLYKAKLNEYVEKEKLEDTVVLVTNIIRRGKGYIGVAYVPQNKKLPVTGFINVAECEKIEQAGQYIKCNFKTVDKGAQFTIKVNGEKYPIQSDTTVEMISDGTGGIKIGEKIIYLGEGDGIEILNATGQVSLDIKGIVGTSGTASGEVTVMNKVTISGDAKLTIVDKGVQLSGDVEVNDTQVADGAVTIKYESMENPVNINVDKANFFGKIDIAPALNKIIEVVISLVKKLVKALFAAAATKFGL